jgi:DNA-directed RNA polymerase subunit N (RpoN/RPB10)
MSLGESKSVLGESKSVLGESKSVNAAVAAQVLGSEAGAPAPARAGRQCPVRCFCGHEIQSAYTRYGELLDAGLSVKDALDACGAPRASPFAPPAGSPNSYVTPPSVCCRALLMCTSDLSSTHNVYQSAVLWAEGETAAAKKGDAPAPLGARGAQPDPPRRTVTLSSLDPGRMEEQ